MGVTGARYDVPTTCRFSDPLDDNRFRRVLRHTTELKELTNLTNLKNGPSSEDQPYRHAHSHVPGVPGVCRHGA